MRLHRCLNNAFDVEIRQRRATGPEHDDFAAACIGRLTIRFADREHRRDAERIARTRDADRDLTSVCNEQAVKQRRRHRAPSL
jgi:hypothetical protein